MNASFIFLHVLASIYEHLHSDKLDMPATTVHSRLKSAPKQDTFTPLRKSTRRRRTTAQPLPLLREQTLTQIDFVRSSSHHSRDISDDGDDDYEEHLQKPPKKKAKRNNKERSASQTTVTQNWRNYVKIYGEENWTLAERDDSSGEVAALLDDDESNVSLENHRFEIADPNDDMAPAGIDDHELLPTSAVDGAHDLRGGTFDYAEHLLSITSLARSSKILRLGSSDVKGPSTRPMSAGSATATAFATPRKNRRTVVPSSETPSSLQLSRHKEYSGDFYQQSPLKERSSNITPAKQSNPFFPERSRCPTQKLFETLTQDVDDSSMGDAAWSARLAFTPRKPATPVSRSLQRATTIQDSQDDDDLDLITSKSASATEANRVRQKTSLDSEPMRSPKRTTTVQDSQAQSDVEDLEAECEQCDYDPRFQQTFDPVIAALERDAARFGRSDTQFNVRLEVDESGDKAGLDFQFFMSTQLQQSQSRDGSVELANGSPTREKEEPAKHPYTEPEKDELPQSATTVAITQERYGDDVRFSPYLRALDQVASAGDVLPDSPASSLHSQLFSESKRFIDYSVESGQVHQSQISTVMPTQRSRPNSAHGCQLTLQQSASTMTINTLSSSPFPLPPRKSSEAGLGAETQDFSLPPPPQFSSPDR